jgi:predicted molibdopterin-dependent oxidoreductase YjgC
MGAYSTALPGGATVNLENAAALGRQWGFEVPSHVGLTAPEMVEAAERDELDVLYLAGGNFLDVLPDPDRVRDALERVPVRVHQDIVLTTQMLLDPPDGGEVILLPAATRYEQEGGGTETTTERRIAYSPPIAVGRIGEARSEWRIFADVAKRVRPDLAAAFSWRDGQALREEIAEIVPLYAGIETLRTTGDSVQYGGRHLAITQAVFSVVDVEPPTLGPNEFEITTRRGKQFNSMVQGDVDPLNGAHRDEILVSHKDAKRLGLSDGDVVVLTSPAGTLRARVKREKLPAGSIQVHWPEGNVLIGAGPENREPRSNVPDYTAIVTLERLP